jgi:hypothetical protein
MVVGSTAIKHSSPGIKKCSQTPYVGVIIIITTTTTTTIINVYRIYLFMVYLAVA